MLQLFNSLGLYPFLETYLQFEASLFKIQKRRCCVVEPSVNSIWRAIGCDNCSMTRIDKMFSYFVSTSWFPDWERCYSFISSHFWNIQVSITIYWALIFVGTTGCQLFHSSISVYVFSFLECTCSLRSLDNLKSFYWTPSSARDHKPDQPGQTRCTRRDRPCPNSWRDIWCIVKRPVGSSHEVCWPGRTWPTRTFRPGSQCLFSHFSFFYKQLIEQLTNVSPSIQINACFW